MSIFPARMTEEIQKTVVDDKKSGYKDIYFDVKSKKIVVEDGKVQIATKKQQIQQWLYLLINTEFGKYKVYENTEFGISFLYEMRGHEYYSSGFTIAQIQDELAEKIKLHKCIDEVKEIKIEKKFNSLVITVVLEVDAETVESEVIYNV
ncbi:DUF2634 domain-containing protein [Fusobacterium mortiferum]|uniref:DUF2634 domain-containing protein n=1 Tax=Fusobacterium mortiferum TaxID=850 RepID=A0ABS2FZV9_FUSMR|nr:DUF2634 domain-containing protein [Fusobacterium mortiferum]MBM6874691.1 DUF2634 domain-containing protein [Fusobacterium mortiferum]